MDKLHRFYDAYTYKAFSCGKLSSLENLKIEFNGYRHITDEGIKALAEGINGLPNLQSLQLWLLSLNGITGERLKGFFKALHNKLPMLKSFNFFLESRHDDLTGDGVMAICEALNVGLPYLEELEMIFKIGVNLTEKVVKALGEAVIIGCHNIQRVKLIFPFCQQIPDAAEDNLREYLAQKLAILKKPDFKLNDY